MRNILKVFILHLFVLSNCHAQEIAAHDVTIKTIVTTTLDNWHKAASEANYENYFSAMDDQSIFVGTDANEVWSKEEFKNFSKPFFDKGKAWSFTNLKRNIYVHSSKKIVWFDEILNTWMGVCRGSGVLEKVNNQWKIKHYVLSITVPNEDIKPIIEIKKKRDATLVNTLTD